MMSYLSRLMLLTAAAAVVLAAPVRLTAADWSQWRGPNFNGSTDATNLPTEFGPDKNLLWKVALPGVSNSTPIVHGDRIFTVAVDDSKNLVALCLNRADGKVLWQHKVGVGFFAKGENNMATPSPVTDGKHVWFLFGTGDLVCFDIDGKQVWARNLQKEVISFNVMWIYGSSPLLHNGKLYIQILHTQKPYNGPALADAKVADGAAPSYFMALDPATGKELFRVVRPDAAVGETKESYGTPIPFEHNGRKEIILIGGDAITGHDPETGTELWRAGGWNPEKIGHWRLVPSVVTGGGVILGCAPKNGPVMAWKAGGNGDITESHKAWWSDPKELTSDVPVPAFYKDHFFVLDQGGSKLSKVEPATGKVVWATKLEGAKAVARASPTAADGKIYAMNVNGDIWVVSADDGKVLHKTMLGGNAKSAAARGSIAAVTGAIYVRVGDQLYAFGSN